MGFDPKNHFAPSPSEQAELLRHAIMPEEFRSLIEGTSSHIITVDPNGRLLYISPRLMSFCDPAHTLSNIFELVSAEDRHELQALFHNDQKRVSSVELIIRIRHHELGSHRLFRIRSNLQTRAEQKVYDVFLQDIDDYHRTKEQLTHAQRLEPVGIMASGLAHDINNQLTAILGQLAVASALNTSTDENVSECLKASEQAAYRAAEMVKRLTNYVRQKDTYQTYFGIVPFFKETLQLIKHVMPSSIRVNLDIDEEALWVFLGDPTALQQVLLNLAINSKDVLGKAGQFTIAASAENFTRDGTPTELVITITDNGSGIPADLRPFIFKPFFTTKEEGKGTGLGLSMVATIVERHDGTVHVDPSYYAGARFIIRLPIKTPLQDDLSSQRSSAKLTPLKIKDREKVVLIVDDDKYVRDGLKSALELVGMKVLLAANSEDALYIAANDGASITCAVVDFRIPGVSGEVIANNLQVQYGIPTLLISGYRDGHARAFARDLPFLPKPFSISHLVERINELQQTKNNLPSTETRKTPEMQRRSNRSG
jgi:two-component system, cell cycle sensor histidine kinase and response regulator CckA